MSAVIVTMLIDGMCVDDAWTIAYLYYWVKSISYIHVPVHITYMQDSAASLCSSNIIQIMHCTFKLQYIPITCTALFAEVYSHVSKLAQCILKSKIKS